MEHRRHTSRQQEAGRQAPGGSPADRGSGQAHRTRKAYRGAKRGDRKADARGQLQGVQARLDHAAGGYQTLPQQGLARARRKAIRDDGAGCPELLASDECAAARQGRRCGGHAVGGLGAIMANAEAFLVYWPAAAAVAAFIVVLSSLIWIARRVPKLAEALGSIAQSRKELNEARPLAKTSIG